MVNADSAVFILWIWLFFGQVLAEPLMNWTTADMYCKDYGGLHPMKNERQSISSDIKDNQSYWLSGFTNYSDFVSWKGCYSSFPSNMTVYAVGENSVYKCIDKCKQKNEPFDFIGLQNQSCYCLSYNNTNDNTKMRVPDQLCEQMENTHVPALNSYVNIYNKLFDQQLFQDSSTEVYLQQCVYINVTQDKVSYGTDSCYTNASGYICVDGSFEKINDTCHSSNSENHSRPYCIRNVSFNWFEANKECRQFNGNLMSLVREDVIKQNIKQSLSLYWIGIFRDFNKEISDEKNDDHVCLSARKYVNEIVFEPDDCLTLKVPWCKGNVSISHPTISTHPMEIVPSTSVTFEENTLFSITVTTDVPDAAAKPDTGSQIAIISSVSAVALICIAFVAFLIVRKLRGAKSRTTLHKVNADNTSAQIELGRVASAAAETASTTVEEAHYSLLENNEIKIDDNVYDRTDKMPTRSKEPVTERNDNIYSHMTNLNDSLQTDDYDVLRLKGAGKSEKMSNELYGACSKSNNTLISDNKTVVLNTSKQHSENRDP